MVQSTEASLKQIRDSQRDLQSGQATLSRQIADFRADYEALPPDRFIYEKLRTPDNLNPANSSNLAVNASADDVVFRHTVPDGERHRLQRLNIAGAVGAKLIPNGFYSLATLAVGSGILIRALDAEGAVICDYGDGELCYHRAQGLLAGVDAVTTEQATPPAIGWGVRWTLAKAGRAAVFEEGQSLEMVLRANFSSFDFWEAEVQGVRL